MTDYPPIMAVAENNTVRSLLLNRAAALGISLSELSDKIGKNRSYLENFIRKGSPRTLKVEDALIIARTLNIKPSELGVPKELLHNSPEKVSTPDGENPAIVPDAGKPLTFERENRPGPKDLPILGYAKAGDMGLFIDNGERQGVTVRPDILIGVEDAYAVRVHDDSMAPALQAGWLLHVDPHRPCRPGDYVVIQMRDNQAFVKILERRTEKHIICRQLNPAGPVRYDVSKWRSMHRVVGAKFLED